MPQSGPFTPADSQRNYQHSQAVSGGEPFSAFGAKEQPLPPVKEASWQSLLSAPLGS